jgi:hypothetical protein
MPKASIVLLSSAEAGGRLKTELAASAAATIKVARRIFLMLFFSFPECRVFK